jgi:Leu/Phe-tRNA-protein transferase
MPTPLEPSVWDFPTLEQMPKDDLVILGADLKPETVIDSYKHGIFPMHIEVANKRANWLVVTTATRNFTFEQNKYF